MRFKDFLAKLDENYSVGTEVSGQEYDDHFKKTSELIRHADEAKKKLLAAKRYSEQEELKKIHRPLQDLADAAREKLQNMTVRSESVEVNEAIDGYAAHKAGKANANNYFMSQVGESLDDYANKGGMHPTQSDAEYNHKKSTHYQATFSTSKGLDYSVRRKDLPVGHPQWSHSVVL